MISVTAYSGVSIKVQQLRIVENDNNTLMVARSQPKGIAHSTGEKRLGGSDDVDVDVHYRDLSTGSSQDKYR